MINEHEHRGYVISAEENASAQNTIFSELEVDFEESHDSVYSHSKNQINQGGDQLFVGQLLTAGLCG